MHAVCNTIFVPIRYCFLVHAVRKYDEQGCVCPPSALSIPGCLRLRQSGDAQFCNHSRHGAEGLREKGMVLATATCAQHVIHQNRFFRHVTLHDLKKKGRNIKPSFFKVLVAEGT